MAQQRFGDRRADGQLALAQVGFVLGDDGVDHLLLGVVIQQRHFAQNLHLALVDFRLVDHPCVGKRILQLGYTHLQHTLRLAGSVVLCVLRKVALVARFGDRRRNCRTLDGTHVIKLVPEFLVPLRRQIDNLFCHNFIRVRRIQFHNTAKDFKCRNPSNSL